MRRVPFLALGALAAAVAIAGSGRGQDEPKAPAELVRAGVQRLLDLQDEGLWPYEGVYRVGGEIPVGYRVGGTAIVCQALLHAGERKACAAAIESGVAAILVDLEHPLMRPSTRDAYDVRVWGHSYALELFCRLRAEERLPPNAAPWIPKLVETLVTEELEMGGWNYASRKAPAAFVTAPVVQALLLARSQGEKVPEAVLKRARASLEKARDEKSGYFAYSGFLASPKEGKDRKGAVPGSIARGPVAETTLVLLGGGSKKAIRASLEAFFEHWDELEKRRKKTGTHEGPYGIAPYYFYYGHRYAAQAIEMLPAADRPKLRARLLERILETRDPDGTWNDRVFPRSRAFGTAMVVLALLGEKQPKVPRAASPD